MSGAITRRDLDVVGYAAYVVKLLLKKMMYIFVDGEITEDDMEVILECAGATSNGKITLSHFRDMIELK